MPFIRRHACAAVLAVLLLLFPAEASARAAGSSDLLVFGIQVSIGGRYDDVRLCVASGKDVPGGIAADISFFAEVGVAENISLFFNVPVMRPILFATAFDMLQFEPFVVLNFRVPAGDTFDFIGGLSLGVSLNYGPDWHSETSGPGRTASGNWPRRNSRYPPAPTKHRSWLSAFSAVPSPSRRAWRRTSALVISPTGKASRANCSCPSMYRTYDWSLPGSAPRSRWCPSASRRRRAW